MSQLLQGITGQQNLLQTGQTPTIQAKKPISTNTAIFESMAPGVVNPRVVILTALPVEFLAVAEHVSNRQEILHSDGTIYEYGQFTSEKVTWGVAIVEIGQGNRRAANETQRSIRAFNPDVILFVGVAGGIKDVSIGDIVAAETIYSYESGRDGEIFKPRPEAENSNYRLLQRARSVVRNWMIRRESDTLENLPKAFVGAIAAGESVVASTESRIAELLKQNYSNVLAVEMEGYGFLAAAREVQNVPAIVIRGISDLLEKKAESDQRGSQKTAAKNATKFAFEVLDNFYGQIDSAQVETSEETDAYEINTAQTLPRNQPRVSFKVLESNEYSISAVHGNNEPLVAQGSVDFMLTQITQSIKSGQDSEIILDELDECHERLEENQSCLIGKFLEWLTTQSLKEQSACLVIENSTEICIPWELLEVDGMPLGVTLQTIHYKPFIKKNPTSSPTQCCQGKLLAYTNKKNYKWQNTYHWHGHSDFSKFLGDLQHSNTDYEVIFIDGFSVNGPLQKRPRQFIKRSSIINKGASLIFINGQLHFEESISLQHGAFLDLFLRHGARGVIGTIGKLKATTSEEVVELFFELLSQSNHHLSDAIPIILKQMRQKAYRALLTDIDGNRASYLATFLYVYYGDIKIGLQPTPNSS